MLRAKGLGFTYRRSSRPALSGLDLSVGPGEMALLAGPSGCGKSTAALGLAGLLGGAVAGTKEGEVILEGPSVDGVGIVQQDPESHLVTLTVRDEVAFGPENLALPREEILERIGHALATVGADHLVDRSTNELSGGEKQRVAIASVLAMRPDVLVLDEPSANLDPRGREDVLDVTMSLARDQGKAVVVSEHRLDRLVDVATEVVVLVNGKASWRGTTEEMISDAEELSRSGVRVPGRPDLLGLTRVEVEPGEPALELEGLVSGYGDTRVLEGVDLVVRAGEMVGLVGPNGGGKTTLLRCILGLAEAWEGSVALAGDDVTGQPTSKMARRVGLVFQSPDHQLFEGTVRAEMEFGPRNMGLMDDPLSSRIAAIATEYGLSEMMDVHPFRLSLGQKRRLNVASVQVSSPRLLMLDEPFIGQDLGSIRALNDRLQVARSEGTAILVVSHDLEAMSSICDRAVVLEAGRIWVVEDPYTLSDGIPWGDAA